MDKKKVIIALAIAIIFTLFIGYGIEVFDPSPKQEDFCPNSLFEIKEEQSCLDQGGDWQESRLYPRGAETPAVPKPVDEDFVVEGYCNPSKECYDHFNSSRTSHDKVVFILAVIFGLIGVTLGIILKMDSVGFGLLIGGVITILYGTIRYWQHANNTLKFILLGIVLAILIWLAYKKLEVNNVKKR